MEDVITLTKYGEPQNVIVRRSSKAKNIAIRITSKGAELVLPLKVKAEKGHNFLLSQEYWVRQKLRRNVTVIPQDEDKISILGKSYEIIHIDSSKNQIKLNDSTLEVYCCSQVLKKLSIEVFLKKKLLAEIKIIVENISKKHNLTYSNIRIMENVSRWGSCCGKGNLVFNWRVVFAPFEVLKYLVAHEMAHLKEMDHSKNFWELVEYIYPEYQPAKLWLKRNGKNLYSYLP
ncbi:MAG TPA: M48 family metallopeptidase [Rickettsia endosymbiont of Proechinophthirus fluctus]|uniref:M48 family metallopeptidase n=1 Tax=Rickettsia endosymbiont of Proechinophthirus fluctus TaxID=1462733 RepID=UPI000789C750|nr:M48 family metallopeptidase [Rickettsia endosymbiont of Proechinophthirus fluctus]KYP97961.1 metal-dependent hydrolase [Rickettsia endosymbiont of Proechinophthirus fluctus]HJD54362.1 M48 family metallopeptidase [Rickettsia endosymbiont of Proechinophthirus fluctus]